MSTGSGAIFETLQVPSYHFDWVDQSQDYLEGKVFTKQERKLVIIRAMSKKSIKFWKESAIPKGYEEKVEQRLANNYFSDPNMLKCTPCRDPNKEYGGTLRAHKLNGSNVMRTYFVKTAEQQLRVRGLLLPNGIEDALVILGFSDKVRQTKLLHELTGVSLRALRMTGVGAD